MNISFLRFFFFIGLETPQTGHGIHSQRSRDSPSGNGMIHPSGHGIHARVTVERSRTVSVVHRGGTSPPGRRGVAALPRVAVDVHVDVPVGRQVGGRLVAAHLLHEGPGVEGEIRPVLLLLRGGGSAIRALILLLLRVVFVFPHRGRHR